MTQCDLSDSQKERSAVRLELVRIAAELKDLARRLEAIGDRWHGGALRWADADISLVLFNVEPLL